MDIVFCFKMFSVTTFLSFLSSTIHVSAILFLFGLIVVHLWSKFKMRRKPVTLDVDSVVIILGGCTGVGRVMALEVARLYHCVIIVVDKRRDLFEAMSEEMKEHDATCQCYSPDLSEAKAVDTLIESIKQSHKRVDLLLYNADVYIAERAWEVTDEDHMKMMSVNYFTPMRIVKGLFPLLEGHHIGVVASLASIMDGSKHSSAYLASKHALFAYMNCLRQELLHYNHPTTISVACPYEVESGMFWGMHKKLGLIFPELKEEYLGKRLLQEFLSKKQVIYIHRYQAILFKILSFFPTFVSDRVSLFFDDSDLDTMKRNRRKMKLK